MTDVEPMLRAEADCPCGCGLYGTVTAKGCVRGCECNRCRGRRNRKRGLDKQTKARKAMGVDPSSKFGDANEESWGDPLFANEVKSGKQCGPVANAWNRAKAQIVANNPDPGGQHKCARVVWMPEGWGKRGLVTVELETWRVLIAPALEHFYGES